MKGLEKRFGGVRAVDGASFAVPEGSITALIGPNGSGKTTVFNLIGGTMSPDAGEVWFDGQRIDRKPPWRRAHLGLGRTFQITRLFREMTVLENVVAPLREFHLGLLNANAVSGREAKRAEELLEFVGMRKYLDVRASALSFGQQKLVELAQILMLDPKLIMLDEPAGGINPTLIERIGEMIRELNAQRQDVPDRRAQHAVRARALQSRARARAREDDRERGAGRDSARPTRSSTPISARTSASSSRWGPEMLKLTDVYAGYGGGDVLQGVELEVPEGSVCCIVGPNGAGKSTVLRAVSGLLQPRKGDVLLEGESTRGMHPSRILAMGVSQVPQSNALFPG